MAKYPVFLELGGRRVVLIGGGGVALRKAQPLLAAGARLVAFDTLHDSRLPPVDGLFIGGGFPETHMKELEANGALRAAVRDAIAAGLPAYAECGGLMYLARSLAWRGEKAEMAGVIPADVVMHDRPRGRGYVRLHGRSFGLADRRPNLPDQIFWYDSRTPQHGWCSLD